MNKSICSFRKSISHFGTHSFICGREVYKDGMCIFHIAKETNIESAEAESQQVATDFRNALKKEIEFATTAAPDYELDWCGTHFPAIKFDKWIFPRKILLTAARFEHGAAFNNCHFDGAIEAIKSDFIGSSENANFTKCHFTGKVNFWSSTFGNNPILSECIFQSLAQFLNCRLEAPDFFGSRFIGGIKFERATFSGACNFKTCEFKNETSFLSIEVEEETSLDFRDSSFSGRLILGAHHFAGNILSYACLDFTRAIVLERASLDFQNFKVITADFSDMSLSDGANLRFENIIFGKANFRNIVQREKTTASFYNTALDNAVFLNTNIEKFNFIDVTWRFIADRQGLVSELELRRKISLLPTDAKLGADDQRELVHEVELNSENYRQLVKNHEAKRNFSLAESFHIGEMEMQRQKGVIFGAEHTGLRRKLTSWNDFSLYFVLSKYGTSYLHSLRVLGIMVMFLASLFLLGGLTKKECITHTPATNDACKIQYYLLPTNGTRLARPMELMEDFVSSALFTLSVATLQKDTLYKTTTVFGEFLRIITVLFIPSQAALTFLAIRRRFRRGSSGE